MLERFLRIDTYTVTTNFCLDSHLYFKNEIIYFSQEYEHPRIKDRIVREMYNSKRECLGCVEKENFPDQFIMKQYQR